MLTVALLALAADPKLIIKPGMWETTVQMEMTGMPFQMPPQVVARCLTEKDLVPDTSQPGQDCKVTKQKVTGSTVEWTAQCKDKGGAVTTLNGKATYKDDTFSGTLQMTSSGGGQPMQMSATISGKRTGPCKKS